MSIECLSDLLKDQRSGPLRRGRAFCRAASALSPHVRVIDLRGGSKIKCCGYVKIGPAGSPAGPIIDYAVTKVTLLLYQAWVNAGVSAGALRRASSSSSSLSREMENPAISRDVMKLPTRVLATTMPLSARTLETSRFAI